MSHPSATSSSARSAGDPATVSLPSSAAADAVAVAVDEEDDSTAEERQQTEADVSSLLSEVLAAQATLSSPHVGPSDPSAGSASSASAVGSSSTSAEGDESSLSAPTAPQRGDSLGEHLDPSKVTLSDRDSAPPSVASSPINRPQAEAGERDRVPSVELRDGGSAAAATQAASAVSAASMSSSCTAAAPTSSSCSASSTSVAAEEEEDAVFDTSVAGGKAGFFDVRVAVVGNVDSGKSTLIGVLTSGALDDGRGKARAKVFIHAHELGTGRTSAISQHILGFATNGEAVHQTVSASAQSAAKTKSWQSVLERSRSVVTFIDLAGHERYLKTTIAGLTGSHPDYVLVLINSLAGVTKMSKEHLGVVLALQIPLICVVTKVDLAPAPVLEQSKKQLFRILKSSAANKLPLQMKSPADIETVLRHQNEGDAGGGKICPVFFISAVDGTHVELIVSYLSRLRPHLEWVKRYAAQLGPASSPSAPPPDPASLPAEFAVDETFNVSGVGIVVSGTLNSGTLRREDVLLLGPNSDRTWTSVVVRSIHYKRVSCLSVAAGQSCALSIRATKRKETLKRNLIRRGMVLVTPPAGGEQPTATRVFEAEVLILHHPTTIKLGYQAVLHLGQVRQTAVLLSISSPAQCLRTSDKSLCRFRFILREEYVHPGTVFVFREGTTKGIGKIVRTDFSDAEVEAMEAAERDRRKGGGRATGQQQYPAAHGHGSSSTARPPATTAQPAVEEAKPIVTMPPAIHPNGIDVSSSSSSSSSFSSSSSSASSSDVSGSKSQKWSRAEKEEFHAALRAKGGKGDGGGKETK